jgi:two-component system, OmpR family, response regulator
MLVLSRKFQETIVLPDLGISVQVLEIRPGVVRLGIDAPPEVTVLRGELPRREANWGRGQSRPADRAAAPNTSREFTGSLLSRLTSTGVGLGLLRLQLDAEHTADARATLAALQNDFQLVLHWIAVEPEALPLSAPATAPKRQKALLVEDDGNQRELLAGFLRQSGLVVDTAGDGADALDYLRTRGAPDLVLLDMGLPRVDGPTTVREIRRNPAFAGLKIFGVTGRLPGEFDLACGPAGVDRWFRKPLDPAALVHDLAEEMEAPLCHA